MKVFAFSKPYTCYAQLQDRKLVPHEMAVTGLSYDDGQAAISGYVDIILEDPSVVKVYAPYKEWEGHVTEVRSDGFIEVNLIDITAGEDEVGAMGTFPIELFDADQRALLQEGVIFRAFCGHTKVAGEESKFEMSFVLYPAWTAAEVHDNRQSVLALAKLMASFRIVE